MTHPHVKDGTLCAGDANLPIQRALEQGRFADAFCLIRSVLTNYNPNSPHVHLNEWAGRGCYDCGGNVHPDDLSWCESCDHEFCQDCLTICSCCESSRCNDCLERCQVCEESCCSKCLSRSAHSGEVCCKNCLEPCSACAAHVLPAELDSQTRQCPACALAQTVPEPIATSAEDDSSTPDSIPMETNDATTTAISASV